MSVNGLRMDGSVVLTNDTPCETGLPLELERDDVYNVHVGSDEQAGGTLVPNTTHVSSVQNAIYTRRKAT